MNDATETQADSLPSQGDAPAQPAQQAEVPQPSQPASAETPAAQPQSDFVVPDEYKERGWVKNIKSSQDLWKTLDNAQALVGKKTVAPDWKTATPNEIEAYYKQIRPADKAEYGLNEVIPEEKSREFYSDLLHKHGISAKQGADLAREFIAQQQKEYDALYDADSFISGAKQAFGAEYEAKITEATEVLRANLSKEDQVFLDQKVPNNYALLFYKFANNIKNAYGIKEGNPPPPGGSVPQDLDKVRGDLRRQIMELESRTHTAQEKLELQNKLAATYKN